MNRKAAVIATMTALIIISACRSGGGGDGVIAEAAKADAEGRTISNAAMLSLYPNSFQPGNPSYLERDFEAGANFICNEIKLKRGKDICSEPDIRWR